MRSKTQQKQVEGLIIDIAAIIRQPTRGVSSFAKARAILALPNIGIIDSDQTASIANFQCLKLIPKE